MTLRITALVLNYNYECFLEDAVRSVLEQRHPAFEIVVADDGSSDDSRGVCAQFAPRGVRFVSGPHVGLARNLDRGLRECSGTHVAFLSADDLWRPDHLMCAAATFSAYPEAGVVYSSFEFVDQDGHTIRARATGRKRRSMPSGRIDPLSLLPSQFIPTQAAVVAREAVERVGGVDISLEYAELDLFVRLAAVRPVAHTGRTTVGYRLHSNSLSRDHERALANRLALYDKHLAPDSQLRRRLTARAHAKTAYRQLRHAEDVAAVRAARRHVLVAITMAPRETVRPLELAVLAATLTGDRYVVLRRLIERYVGRHRRLRLALQKVLWMGR